MAEKKTRAKHVGYAAQREFCRNNKHTYIEKFDGDPILMCMYPFPDPYHKRGVCRANTCTDMREIPQDITVEDEEAIKAADDSAQDTICLEVEPVRTEDDVYSSGIGEPTTDLDTTHMPCPSND
jgi:hypothetical protein